MKLIFLILEEKNQDNLHKEWFLNKKTLPSHVFLLARLRCVYKVHDVAAWCENESSNIGTIQSVFNELLQSPDWLAVCQNLHLIE